MALILREDDVRAVLTMPDTVNVLEAAFRRQGADDTRNHPRARIILPDNRGVLHVLPAFVPGEPGHPEAPGAGLIGLKSYTAFAGGVRFSIQLFSAATGELLALLEADYLGQMRTGAASGLATRHMAREDAATLGIIGTGLQARTQALAIAAVRPLRAIRVFGRDLARRAAFAADLGAATGVATEAVESAEAATREMDIMVTMTTARDPVLHGAWLASGAHVNAAGSNWGTRREVDDETIERSAVVAVDDVAQAKIEAGDLIIPASVGRFDWERAVELGQIIAGRVAGRPDASAITFFKSIGIGLEDIAVAGHVYALARARGLGAEFAFLP